MSAQYPNAVKSFTSRNAGDVIQPAHVNDLQDEVNAIEAGLLNGTAPMNSSNSTVSNLSVTGGSTFGGVVSMLQQPACRLQVVSSVTVLNGTFTALNFNLENFNIGPMHSTASNSSRITFPSTGYYFYTAHVRYAASSVGQRIVRVVHSADGEISRGTYAAPTAGGGEASAAATDHYQITSTAHFLTVETFQDSGGSLEAGAVRTYFSARRLG